MSINQSPNASEQPKRAHTNLGDLQINVMLKGWRIDQYVNQNGEISVTFINVSIEKSFTLTGTSLLSIFKRATDAITVLEN